jgi:hypothetical protein
MENKFIFDLEQQLTNIDIDSIKLDAIIQLKTWEKNMFSLIEKIYSSRLNEIDEFKTNIIINQIIPENFYHLIEQTISIKRVDDDDFVIIDIDKNEEVLPTTNTENCISKIFHSEPVQQALVVSLANTLTHMGTMTATSTTTIAATTMVKTILLTTAYGIGRIAMDTTKKILALVISSNDV